MTDEQLNVALKVFDARMQEITDAYIERMAQHIKDIGQLTPSDVHVLTEYTRMNSNMRAMKRIIAIKSNKLVSDVEKIFQRAADDDEEWAAQYFKRAGKKASGTNKDYIKDIIQAQLNVTKNTLENLSQTTVTSSAYKQAVDKACQSVQTGVVDYRKAIRSTVKEASREGLRVRYESGLTRRLDTAARQNVLDSVRALNRDILKRVGEEFGADGVEISAHGLCAEDHLPYQGRQFSNEKFEKIQESLKRPIGQWNCKHTIYPIILGVSVQAIDNEELKHYTALSAQQITIDGKTKSRYQWSQEQRKVETEIRYLKDEANACKAMGDMQGRRETQAKIDALQEYYAHISAESGIGEEKWRMSVSGFSPVKAKSDVDNVASSWYNKYVAGNSEKESKYSAILEAAKQESKIKGTLSMPTIPDFLEQIGFDDKHINHERNHGVTKEQAISYIQNAVVQVERNKGAYIKYYSVDGAAYVMPRKKLIRTAVKAEDYQKDVAKMLEVILNGVE